MGATCRSGAAFGVDRVAVLRGVHPSQRRLGLLRVPKPLQSLRCNR